MSKGRLWRQASLSIGALLGSLEEGSFTRNTERRRGLEIYRVSCGSSVWGTWREGSFNGDPKGYAK